MNASQTATLVASLTVDHACAASSDGSRVIAFAVAIGARQINWRGKSIERCRVPHLGLSARGQLRSDMLGAGDHSMTGMLPKRTGGPVLAGRWWTIRRAILPAGTAERLGPLRSPHPRRHCPASPEVRSEQAQCPPYDPHHRRLALILSSAAEPGQSSFSASVLSGASTVLRCLCRSSASRST